MVRRLFLIFALICGPSLAASVPTDEDAFTKLVADHVGVELPDYNVAPAGKLTLEGKRSDGESLGALSLDRIYAYCLRNAPRCDDAIGQYSKQIAGMIKERNRPIERGMIRLAVRTTAYADQVSKQVAAMGGTMYSHPVAPGLVSIPVLDFSQSIRYVTDKDLAKLRLNEQQLFQIGDANLRAGSKPLSEVTPIPGSKSFGSITGEDYAASRILEHEDWKAMSGQLHDSLIVMLPAPDVLVYGDGSTDDGRQALRTFAAQVARRSDHPLTLVMLRWTEQGWDLVE
jgi:uncharacterized protein YtpQ (UPF0354 family)